MDLLLSDAQRTLLDTSMRFIKREWPIARVRDAALGTGDDGRSRTAAELGWFTLLVPEEFGGGSLSDDPLVDCILVARARGADLCPDNFVGTNVVAAALAAAGSTDQVEVLLSQLISGAVTAAWVAGGTGSGTGPTAGVSSQHIRGGPGYILRGKKAAVADVVTCDWILVSALTGGGGASQFLVPADAPGVRIVELDGLDITRRFADVLFDDVTVPEAALLGTWGEAAELIDQQLQLAAVLTMGEMVGAMTADFALALDYAKTRTAFGRPIGSFQAVKHLLADTSLLVETSDAMVFAAGRALGRRESRAAEAVSMAKAYVSDAGIEVVHNCFQVFGGVGFTWEHDQHLYLRRVTTDALRYGDASWHRERLCQLVGV
ncbi:acyl-CoA dehydrogenase family protein [uncultured Jatrophihabitans sp.]|uniref:acyl-CoA dehydrogenase family protein n=1 Tax=uncultured Jatrophihabitans sp. TaxID=1610747 RepID=UPI0035CBC1A0